MKITYEDKELAIASAQPIVKKWRFEDANEVKEVVNANEAAVALLTPYNEILVKQLSDLPTPVTGVITLDQDNTLYDVSGTVALGANRFVIDADNVKICGKTSLKDGFTSTTTGVLFSANERSLSLENLTIAAASSTKIVDISNSGTHSFSMRRTVIASATTLGTFTGLKILDIRDNFFTGFTEGFTVSGAYDAIIISENLAEVFTGILFDLNGSTTDAIAIQTNAITLQTGATFLEIAPNGANIITGGEGTIFGNKINIVAGGTPIVGYTSFETEWGVDLNDKILTSDRSLPTGWGFYSDGETSPATQVFNTTPSKLLIDGLGSDSDESHLPRSIRGVSSFWDAATSKILPITNGDSFDFRVNVVVLSKSGNPTQLTLQLDIGGGVAPIIVVARDDKSVAKTPPYALIFTFPIFTLATFVANKGQIFLSVDTGSVTVTTRKLLLIRTSSGAA